MSMRVFDGFKFTKLPTPIHRMDPRAKFLVTAAVFGIALAFTNLLVLLVAFLAQLPLVILAKTGKRWAASMRAGAFLAVFIFITNFVFGSTFVFSLAMTLRFICIMSSFSFFFMTTSPDDLGLALERAHIPYMITFTFTTAVRLVPTIMTDAQTVIDAQRSRGLELDRGNFLKRIRNYIPILIPLIVSAIRRSIELAEALESRAFDATKKRESLVRLKMNSRDYVTIIGTVGVLIVAAYVYRFVPLPQPDIPITFPSIWG